WTPTGVGVGTWAKIRDTSATVTARNGHAMAWDGTKIVLFGGTDATGDLNDLYDYNPATGDFEASSMAAASQGPPAARHGHAQTSGTVNAMTGVVMFGGLGAQRFADTWLLTRNTANNKLTWTDVTDVTMAPAAVAESGLIYDGTRLVLFGGATGSAIGNVS